MLLLLTALVLSQSPEATLTGVVKSSHFEVRYRPGSRAAAEADRSAAMAERDLERICAGIGVKPSGGYALFLYDDTTELEAITGVSGTAGFSSGRESHVPWDNDQTRFHELVHIVAYQLLPHGKGEERNLFFAEGLANALLEFVTGVHVHAVAKFYRKDGKLPPLEELTRAKDFYEWLRAHPGFNAYDVGGSYFRYLLDTYGPAKTATYYSGTSTKGAFGHTEAEVEKGWHKALDAYVLRPEVEALLKERHGEAPSFTKYSPPKGLPADLLGAASEWRSLMEAELRPDDPACWKRVGEGIVGSCDKAAWKVCELGTEEFGDCVVRARIKTPTSGPIQLRVGSGNQAMLVNGTFLYNAAGPVAHSALAAMDGNRKVTDFVVVRRGAEIEIWIDEVKVLSTTGDATPAPVGLAFHQGTVTFEEVRVRPLR